VKALRIALIAFNYRVENLRLLPWRYIHEVSKQLLKLNHEMVVITDGYPELPRKNSIENVPVIRLRHVKHFPPRDFDEIAATVARIDPDVVLWLMGLTSFFQRRLFERLEYPIVALVESRIGVIASDSVDLHYGGLDNVRAVLDELEAHINATRTFIAECEMGIKHEL